MPPTENQRLFFRDKFRSLYHEDFQSWLEVLLQAMHPTGDFQAIRKTQGDGGLDGFVISSQLVYAIYAPTRRNEDLDSKTATKIRSDFAKASSTLGGNLKAWIFVHNHPEGMLGQLGITAINDLKSQNPSVDITVLNIDSLWEKLSNLPDETLNRFFGAAILDTEDEQKKKPNEARKKLNLAQELVREGKQTDAVREMKEALAIARTEKHEEEEVEILVALSLLSTSRHGNGDKKHYFKQAEKKADKLKSSSARAIYFRARASVLEGNGDYSGAEDAYKAALLCCTEPEDEDKKDSLAIQRCVTRASFVHFLCNEKRLDEAEAILIECEDYARHNEDAAGGELFQAALEAGIHFSIESNNEDGAIARIHELEQFANTSGLANRIAGDLVNIANRTAHRDAYQVALVAAQAAIRLARHTTEMPSSFLVGALYTEAMVIFKGGDNKTALSKAEGILDLCKSQDDAPIRYATQYLMAEIQRLSGDSQVAVDLARKAFSEAKGEPEDISFAKCSLARALNDNGQTEEALSHVKEAWELACQTVPPKGAIEILAQISNYASQLGSEEDVTEIMNELDRLPDISEELKADKSRVKARANANRQLRERFLEVLQQEEPASIAGTQECASLQEANSVVVRPLLRLWDDLKEAQLDELSCVTGVYDFWGRGNFERMLLNTRIFPNSFNITLEVRSLDDIKRALRIWGLYADFLMLLWKGPTENGMAVIPYPADYGEPGGWGYDITAGSVFKAPGSKKTWHPAVGYISIFPVEVAAFLASEALPFVRSGRLIVVPAVGVGCINPGHGPFEQLLAEAANAIPSIRWKGIEGTPIGYVPHSPNAPFELLADLAESESTRLRKLRLLLLKRSRQLKPDGESSQEARILTLEIDDALRDLEDRNNELARKKGLEKAKEPLVGATARFRLGGQKLAEMSTDSPFAPLLILQNLGYGWRVEGPGVPKFPPRFEPQEGDVVGTWLAPPTDGWMSK